jgi:hypothetical protein
VKLAERRKSRLFSESLDHNNNNNNNESVVSSAAGGGQGGRFSMKRSQSASSLMALGIVDYDALPYRKESLAVTRERKKLVNSRRHYLEQRQQGVEPNNNNNNNNNNNRSRSRSLSPESIQAPPLDYNNNNYNNNNIIISSSAPPRSRSASPAVFSIKVEERGSGGGDNRSIGGMSQGQFSRCSQRTINLTDAVKYDLQQSQERARDRADKQHQEKLQRVYGQKQLKQPTKSETNTFLSLSLITFLFLSIL